MITTTMVICRRQVAVLEAAVVPLNQAPVWDYTGLGFTIAAVMLVLGVPAILIAVACPCGCNGGIKAIIQRPLLPVVRTTEKSMCASNLGKEQLLPKGV